MWGAGTGVDVSSASIARMDLVRIRESLPADLREIFDLLAEYTIKEAAEKLGIPCTIFASRVKKLRDHLLRRSFKDYFSS